MKKTIILIFCFCLLAATAQVSAQTDVFRKWMQHVEQTYYIPMVDNMTEDQKLEMRVKPVMLARVLGYALSMQLKYIRRDTSEHRIWKMLESRTESTLNKEVKRIATIANLNQEGVDVLRKELQREFAAATVGWHDQQMAVLTSVNQTNAPNFFDILNENTGEEQVENQQTDYDDPVETGNTDTGNQTYSEPRPDPVPDPYENQRTERGRQPWDAILGEWTFDEGRSHITIMINHDPSGDPKKYSAHIVSAGSWQQEEGYAVVGQQFGIFTYHTTRANGEILFYLAKVDQRETAATGRLVFVGSTNNVILRPENNQMSIGKNRRYSRWYRSDN